MANDELRMIQAEIDRLRRQIAVLPEDKAIPYRSRLAELERQEAGLKEKAVVEEVQKLREQLVGANGAATHIDGGKVAAAAYLPADLDLALKGAAAPSLDEARRTVPTIRAKLGRWWGSVHAEFAAMKDRLVLNLQVFGNKIGRSISHEQLKARIFPVVTIPGKWAMSLSRGVRDVFSKEIVTVNVEGTELRYLVARGKRVVRVGTIPLEAGAVKDGLIMNVQAVSKAIDQHVSSKRLTRKKVIASLSGFQSVHRSIELPRMSKRLLSEAIKSEARRAMPVSLEQLYLSWQTVGKGEETQRVFLLGIPRNMLDAEAKCLYQSKLRLRAMNLKPVALARMADRAEALIIDIEPESCEIVMVAGGVPSVMRTIPTHSEYDPLFRAQHILQEYERMVRFCESSSPDFTIGETTPLFLTGKLAGEGNLSQVIADAVGLNIEPLIPPLEYSSDLPLAQYAVNIGLALKTSSAKRGDKGGRFLIDGVDILPEAYRPKRPSVRQTASVLGIAAGVAVLFPLFQMGDSAATTAGRLQNEYSVLEQSFGLRQIQIKEAKEIEQAIASAELTNQKLTEILKDYQAIGEERQRAYDSLWRCITSTPEGCVQAGMILSSVSLDSSEIDLVGQAIDYDTALDYANAVRQVQGFSNVQVRSVASGGSAGDMVTFSISLKWE